jgi:hypothetical protein
MVLIVDETQLEARFDPFGDSAKLDVRLVHHLRRMYHRLENHFGRTRWNCYAMMLKSKLVLVRFVIVLMLTHDSCTICLKCIIASEIGSDAPDGTPR